MKRLGDREEIEKKRSGRKKGNREVDNSKSQQKQNKRKRSEGK